MLQHFVNDADIAHRSNERDDIFQYFFNVDIMRPSFCVLSTQRNGRSSRDKLPNHSFDHHHRGQSHTHSHKRDRGWR